MHLLRDLVAPSTCDGCGVRAAPPWCDACDAVARPTGVRCVRCGGPERPGHGCWPAAAPVDATVVLRAWRGGLAAALARAKDVGRREVLDAAGRRLGAQVLLAGHALDAVVGVPTDRRRARRRGLDHTAALASGVAAGTGLPVARPLRPAGRLPDRGRLDAAARAVAPPPPLRLVAAVPHRVLLVDDVLTTGGTVGAVAALLRDAGARAVVVAVVARAGSGALGARWASTGGR